MFEDPYVKKSMVLTTGLTVTATDDPVRFAAGCATLVPYKEDNPAIDPFPASCTLSDPDSTQIASVVISFAESVGTADVFNVTASSFGNITVTDSRATNQTITLRGPASISDYQTAVNSLLIYDNTGPNPGGVQVNGTILRNIAYTFESVSLSGVSISRHRSIAHRFVCEEPCTTLNDTNREPLIFLSHNVSSLE